MNNEEFARMQARKRQGQQATAQEQRASIVQPPLDRFGAVIRRGDHVIYRPTIDLVFQVVDVKPPVDPRLPPGMVTVILASSAPLTIQGGMPQGNLIAIGVTKSNDDPAPDDLQPPAPEAEPPLDDPAV